MKSRVRFCPAGEHYTRTFEDGRVQHGRSIRLKDGDAIPPGVEVVNVTGSSADESYACETILDARGPARVNSNAFRQNWETIFGTKTAPGSA